MLLAAQPAQDPRDSAGVSATAGGGMVPLVPGLIQVGI